MDSEVYLRFVLAFVLVIGLILLGAGLLRRVSGRLPGLAAGRKGTRRLKIVETLAVDPRRRLVLVRRDGVEHLLLIGGTTDLVVERALAAPGEQPPPPPPPPPPPAKPEDAGPGANPGDAP